MAERTRKRAAPKKKKTKSVRPPRKKKGSPRVPEALDREGLVRRIKDLRSQIPSQARTDAIDQLWIDVIRYVAAHSECLGRGSSYKWGHWSWWCSFVKNPDRYRVHGRPPLELPRWTPGCFIIWVERMEDLLTLQLQECSVERHWYATSDLVYKDCHWDQKQDPAAAHVAQLFRANMEAYSETLHILGLHPDRKETYDPFRQCVFLFSCREVRNGAPAYHVRDHCPVEDFDDVIQQTETDSIVRDMMYRCVECWGPKLFHPPLTSVLITPSSAGGDGGGPTPSWYPHSLPQLHEFRDPETLHTPALVLACPNGCPFFWCETHVREGCDSLRDHLDLKQRVRLDEFSADEREWCRRNDVDPVACVTTKHTEAVMAQYRAVMAAGMPSPKALDDRGVLVPLNPVALARRVWRCRNVIFCDGENEWVGSRFRAIHPSLAYAESASDGRDIKKE